MSFVRLKARTARLWRRLVEGWFNCAGNTPWHLPPGNGVGM